MYWSENSRTLIFFKEDQLFEYKIRNKKIPVKEINLFHVGGYSGRNIMELVRQASIVKYFDDETLEFRCFKNRDGKEF